MKCLLRSLLALGTLWLVGCATPYVKQPFGEKLAEAELRQYEGEWIALEDGKPVEEGPICLNVADPELGTIRVAGEDPALQQTEGGTPDLLIRKGKHGVYVFMKAEQMGTLVNRDYTLMTAELKDEKLFAQLLDTVALKQAAADGKIRAEFPEQNPDGSTRYVEYQQVTPVDDSRDIYFLDAEALQALLEGDDRELYLDDEVMVFIRGSKLEKTAPAETLAPREDAM